MLITQVISDQALYHPFLEVAENLGLSPIRLGQLVLENTRPYILAHAPDWIATLLKSASSSYYLTSDPLLTDVEFDALRDILTQIDPDNKFLKQIGTSVKNSVWPKVKHVVPMGSLLKENTLESLETWYRKYTTGTVVLSDKLDGNSISLLYENGKLIQAISRGDGETGDDITPNVLKMKVPKIINVAGKVHVRGEMILPTLVWAQEFLYKTPAGKNPPKNPRNSVSGASRRLDGANCEHIEIYAYALQMEDGPPTHFPRNAKLSQFQMLQELGFETPGFGHVTTFSEIIIKLQHWESVRALLPYEIDGVVVEANDIEFAESLGVVDSRPKAARAYKFTASEAESVLHSVDWQVGRTQLTPVGRIDPVNIGGVTISNVSLMNIEEIGRIGAKIGSKVKIERCNDVIPRVTSSMDTDDSVSIEVPEFCPSCNTETERSGPHVFCPNTQDCPAQRQALILHYLETLDVKGFGDKLVEKLMAAKKLMTPCDLYELSIRDIATLEGGGEKVAIKVLRDLRDKSDGITLPTFIKSLGIESVGESATEKAMEKFPTLATLQQATIEELSTISGIGPSTAQAMVQGLENQRYLIEGLLPHVLIIETADGPYKGLVFCFTGIRDRDAEFKITAGGGKVTEGYNKSVTHLVCKDPLGKSNKLDKARKDGKKIIGINELNQYVS